MSWNRGIKEQHWAKISLRLSLILDWADSLSHIHTHTAIYGQESELMRELGDWHVTGLVQQPASASPEANVVHERRRKQCAGRNQPSASAGLRKWERVDERCQRRGDRLHALHQPVRMRIHGRIGPPVLDSIHVLDSAVALASFFRHPSILLWILLHAGCSQHSGN